MNKALDKMIMILTLFHAYHTHSIGSRFSSFMKLLSYRYVTKNIMDANSCVVPWTHGCKVWTSAFDAERSTVIRELDMPPTIAIKHHYRYCQLNVGNGNCDKDRSVTRLDDIMLRYADKLAVQLNQKYRDMNLSLS